MRAVVVGGSGQIGGWLLRHLATRGHEAIGTYNTVAYPGLVPLDGSDYAGAAQWVRDQKPDAIFFPAGFTYVDGCQKDPAKAHRANVEQPMNLARVAAELRARFVYFSTDYVFDGTHGPNSESDPTHPVNVYGQSKLDAEQALIHELGDAAFIARTSWVFGPERQGKNFAYQLVKSLRQGKPMTVPTDMASNPSYGPDVAKAVVILAEKGHSGLIHVVGPQVIPRIDFARELAKGFDLDLSLILGKTTAELGGDTPRPIQGGLTSDRLEAILPGQMRDLAATIADFRTQLASGDGWADPTA